MIEKKCRIRFNFGCERIDDVYNIENYLSGHISGLIFFDKVYGMNIEINDINADDDTSGGAVIQKKMSNLMQENNILSAE